MKNKISIKAKHILAILGEGLYYDLRNFDKVIVVGGGKASGAMAEALEQTLPKEIEFSGVVSILEGTSSEYRTRKIALLESSHPVPSEKSVKTTTEIMEAVCRATKNSLVICLISGGGSSLMALPANGITLNDKIKTTNLLLRSGACIEKINCVRKHLSLIKGGQTCEKCKRSESPITDNFGHCGKSNWIDCLRPDCARYFYFPRRLFLS